MKAVAVHPRELGAAERQRWDALRAGSRVCASPYFSWGYVQSVGAARANARVVVLEDGGAIQGFLPVQRTSPFAAMGLGAPISDMQGVIGDPALQLDSTAVCRALRVGRVDLLATPLAMTSLTASLHGRSETFVTLLDAVRNPDTGAALWERSARTQKKQARRTRKMEREQGPLRFTPNNRDRADLEALLNWKRVQCRETRQPPVWETDWVRDTIDRIWACDSGDLTPILSTLHSGDRLAAATLLLQSGPILHVWMIGHEPELGSYSPGVQIGELVVQWAADAGYAEMDWGGGHYGFKDMLSHEARPLAWGSLHGASVSGLMRACFYGLRRTVEGSPVGPLRDLPGKAMRRLDVYRGLGLTPGFLP